MSPGAPLSSHRQRCPGVFTSQRVAPTGAGECRAVPTAVPAAPFGSLPLSVPALGLVHLAASGATFVVSPELMAAMGREQLLNPDVPPPLTRSAPFCSIRP